MQEPAPVGIIANPASGKDIRRLVAHGSTFDNNEKANIIRRILIALGSLGVTTVWYMPDTHGLVPRAFSRAKSQIMLQELPMPVLGNAGDSTEAAQRLRDLGVACIITLGGDGTNRAVAKGCGAVPLVPVSTGTNNVFPQMVEGTLAGMAAAAVALGLAASAVVQRPRLDVSINGQHRDIALVDVVLTSQPWIGSRAFWRTEHLHEVVLSHIPSSGIGISSLGPLVAPGCQQQPHGLYARIGAGGQRVICPIAPGLMTELSIAEHRLLGAGETVALEARPGTVALDGEREIEIKGSEVIEIRLNAAGPRVVNVDSALHAATAAGLFNR